MPAMTVEEAFQTALSYHQAGQLAEAEALYRQIIAAQPHHADTLHMLGILAQQIGRSDIAADLISKAVVNAPAVPEIHYNLGNVLCESRQFAAAAEAYRQAIALRPNYPDAFFNRGNALNQIGKITEAIDSFRQATALRSDFPEAHTNLGNTLGTLGETEQAIASYQQALQYKPNLPETLSNLAALLTTKGRVGEAILLCQRAIALEPAFADAHTNLGNAFHAKDRTEEAINCHRQAIRLQPNNPKAHNNLGNALNAAGQYEEAISKFRQAIVLQPDYPEAHSNLGCALKNQGRLDAAFPVLRHAVACSPTCPEFHINLAGALCETGAQEEAIRSYRRAINLNPNLADAHASLASALLLRGNFREGWTEYEWRWKTKEVAPFQRIFAQPQWDGAELAGRAILLHAEQGLGDTLQFIRYAPLVAQRGARVIVECQPELKTLLENAGYPAQILARGEPLPSFDFHCPLLSLPLAFGTTLETIPAAIPYLRADTEKIAHWRERLGSHVTPPNTRASRLSPPKVGLVWAGGTRPDYREASRMDRRRSMNLAQFAPFAEAPGVTFVSLQKGTPSSQAKMPPDGMTLLDWTDDLHDFTDTAALVEALDLVIAVDTSVAHLAGALGKPVWLLNRFDTCWRWMLGREDTPWYPTMRIFRQPTAGNWDSVIQRTARELASLSNHAISIAD